MSILDLVLFLGGLVLLVVGAEGLVRGATRLGRLAGLSPLVIGLTIVSFATTAPEASVSIVASADGIAIPGVGRVPTQCERWLLPARRQPSSLSRSRISRFARICLF